MAVAETKENNVVVLTITDKLDTEETTVLEKKVVDLLEAGEITFLFDFSDLDYINSSGLRVLVMAYQRLMKHQGKVAICSIKDYIQEIFEISGYDKLFAIYPTRDEAMAEIGA